MSESGPDSLSGKKLKTKFDRGKEEINRNNDNKETHGLRDDIDVNTSISDVKAPNVFDRAKEEIEALVQALHPKKESQRDSTAKDYPKSVSDSEKSPNLIEKVEKELKALGHKPHHHKETHGTSDDIDETTPISEVKGPNIFERAKEEIEALIQTIYPKKEGHNKD